MRMLQAAALVLSLPIALSACNQQSPLDSQMSRLEASVKSNRVGFSSDYWIVKVNNYGVTDRVALVFGLLDDAKFCQDLINAHMRQFPGERYTCLAAN